MRGRAERHSKAGMSELDHGSDSARGAEQYVWLNVSMFVRGTPSVLVYTLVSQFDSDWPCKLVVFLLAITMAMEEVSDYK